MILDEIQSRLVILYTMRCLKTTVTEEMFNEVIAYQDIIDYFTMYNFIYELEKMEMIKPIEYEGVKRYDITKKGIASVQALKSKVPLSIRDKIYNKAYDINQREARGRRFITDITPIDESKYLAKCGLYERGTPLLEVSVFAGSKKNATEIAERFKKNASMVFQTLLEKIVEED